MKKQLVVLLIGMCGWTMRSSGAPNWTFANGPWHAAITTSNAIGNTDEGTVMYTVHHLSKTLTRTTDGGETWDHLTLPTTTIDELLCVACEENNPDVAYLGLAPCFALTCGEVWKSNNRGGDWERIFTTEYSAPVKIAVSPLDPQLVYVGSKVEVQAIGYHYGIRQTAEELGLITRRQVSHAVRR